MTDPLADAELDAVRDAGRPQGWYELAACGGCGTAPMWVGGDARDGGGHVQNHRVGCSVAARIARLVAPRDDEDV